MFEYLSERGKKAEHGGDAPDATAVHVSVESDKQSALLEAERVAADEAAAVEFILHCGFADARLRAAEHVYSAPLLEKVLQSTRKVDRRVAKLMQTRLDAITKSQLIAKHAEDCLDAAHRLLQEMPLMPNRVADIDRVWRSIGEVNALHQSRFDALRSEMESRLAAQAALQRSAIDTLEKLRDLNRQHAALSADALAVVLDGLAQDWAAYRQAPEFSSLPKNLVGEFDQEYLRTKAKEVLPKAEDKAANASALLASWEAAEVATLDVNEIKQAWAKLTEDGDKEAPALQGQFDALLDRMVSKSEKKLVQKPNPEQSQAFANALQTMEQAIQDGQLHIAMEQDEALRKIEKQLRRPSHAQVTRLNQARAGLKRLQGWARWSGNVSREELIKFVEAFPSQKMPVPELAKAVSGIRDRWKALDVQSGAAPKALWERFDGACTTAYAPVAERLKKQAQERQQNKEKAEALLADMQKFFDASGLNRQADQDDALDWKRIIGFYQGMMQSWQRIGHMDRKEKKRLDASFETLRQLLLQPVSQRWEVEIDKRERLIGEAHAIAIADRKAIDKVRAIQQRWQECAKSIPLEYKTEQALWQRFRAACDAVFAQRKATAVAADAERQKNAERKEALCAMLEAGQNESEAAIKNLLRETDLAWKKTGPVPNAREKQIDARYTKALGVLRGRLKAVVEAARQAQQGALSEKMALCRAVEEAVTTGALLDDSWKERWQKIPSLHGTRESLLRKRFDAAVHALSSDDRAYAKLLESNGPVLQKEVLRAEIMAGLESPPERSKERLQMQVEVLQASLSGQNVRSLTAQMDILCATPGLADETTVARMARLFKKFQRDGVV